jgi:hypothetical protein
LPGLPKGSSLALGFFCSLRPFCFCLGSQFLGFREPPFAGCLVNVTFAACPEKPILSGDMVPGVPSFAINKNLYSPRSIAGAFALCGDFVPSAILGDAPPFNADFGNCRLSSIVKRHAAPFLLPGARRCNNQ